MVLMPAFNGTGTVVLDGRKKLLPPTLMVVRGPPFARKRRDRGPMVIESICIKYVPVRDTSTSLKVTVLLAPKPKFPTLAPPEQAGQLATDALPPRMADSAS